MSNLTETIYEPIVRSISGMSLKERRELAKSVGKSEAAIRFIGNRQTAFCRFDLAEKIYGHLFPDHKVSVGIHPTDDEST